MGKFVRTQNIHKKYRVWQLFHVKYMSYLTNSVSVLKSSVLPARTRVAPVRSTNVTDVDLRTYSRIVAVPLTRLYVYSAQNYI
jgi:hypothetical protein